MEGKEGGVGTIIGGDFNTRTGREGGRVSWEEWEEEEMRRNSRDRKMNREGRKLVEWIKDKGWFILNGGMKGNEEGN